MWPNGTQAAKELDREPVEQHECGGDLDAGDEDDDEDESVDSGARVEQGESRPSRRQLRRWRRRGGNWASQTFHDELSRCRDVTREQVKDEVLQGAQRGLDV